MIGQPAGWYDFVCNGRNADGLPVSTGLYLYHLQAGGQSETIKMVYLK
jgi:hypothetical protein